MARPTLLATALIAVCVAPALAQKTKKKVKPNINRSKEFRNVFHSPSADETPKVFRSVLQMEIVIKKGDADATVIYANGIVVSKDGLIASVVAAPSTDKDANGGIQSASVLFLDGSGADASLVTFDAAHGTAVFRVKGLEAPPLRLSKAPLVANRLLNWHAVYKIGGKRTFLYTRPLRMYKTTYQVGETTDLCRLIDRGSSSLSAARSGSALVALDGSVVALMGRLKHWNVSPKNKSPRTKTAWAVPASVIAKLVESAKSK